jgi:hypothetical protein
LLEPLAQVITPRDMSGKNLDRDESLQARVTSFVHLTHTTCPESSEDFVRSQASSGRKRHMVLSDFTPPNPFMPDSACETSFAECGLTIADYCCENLRTKSRRNRNSKI